MNDEGTELVARMRRLMHNVVTYNAHMLQGIYGMIPEMESAEDADAQEMLVRTKVANDTHRTASLIRLLLKNNILLKRELAIFDRIFDSNRKAVIGTHEIRKAVDSVTHTFFQSLNDRGIRIISQDSTDTVNLDYDLFCVALVHLMENAAKYVAPNTVINILYKISGTEYWVVFDMISLAIEPSEVDRIRQEGQRGALPVKLGLGGKGIGLWLITEVMERMSGKFLIRRDVNPIRKITIGQFPYENNQFILVFKSSQVQ